MFLKIWKIAENPQLSLDVVFRTLITARNSTFSASPPTARPTREPDSARNLANSYSQLPTEKGPFPETDGLPGILLKFWEIVGNLPRLDGALFWTLISAIDAPFSASF